ncbi:TonB-dependent receptor [Algoriphagus yeomjeoni]|uniref:Fe(3+) dicitrate transport protein n=1 Tax=Algoriphagus yeomjeoni TaxID=291403 RepID=A0A327P360_9BACT|nr:TonB-dependent receptor [Algoriphagus yeomjeoni]RAI86749.1 Fe(3+) dicitrate transport protein [Algoriphagus yeomjeoni]
MKFFLLILLFILINLPLHAQVLVKGSVESLGETLPGANVYLKGTAFQTVSDQKGAFTLSSIPQGEYTLVVFFLGNKTFSRDLTIGPKDKVIELKIQMEEISGELNQVTVEGNNSDSYGIIRLNSVEGTAIYEAKKNEVIQLDNITANLATNNSRQIYAKVPGLNIYESDGAGLQLGIGARGLDPNRTSHFNVRQNGYDISADALGYPESYYTPATEGVARIEVVRGAASLQYGTQFGGLLNFVMKDGPEDKKAKVVLRNTVGSYGFLNTFSSVGGTLGKWNYYSFFQYKRGDGWRENSGFDSKMAYTSLSFKPNERFKVKLEYTVMDYLARQAGGLTDALFAQNPRQSIRSRNWFKVNWNLFASQLDFKINNQLKLNLRNFGLIGGRDALGNLGRIDRVDDGLERNLFVDDFRNFGSELRLIYNYRLGKQENAFLIGSRYYNGFTDRKQGLGSAGNDADFRFLNPQNLEDADYDFPGRNFSVFAENVFNLSDKISLTPGIRVEYIRTAANGYYAGNTLVPDPATGFARDSTFKVFEKLDRKRSFVFGGLGFSFKPKENHEFYANFSQNYRSINFNDIRVNNPNLVVDENIQDERGYNFDLGIRGSQNKKFNYDVSFFYLKYRDRIGAILRTDPESFRIFRYRTNVADAYSLGLEAFGEFDLLRVLEWDEKYKLNFFTNISLIDARYQSSEEQVLEGNRVELVPPFSIRSGATFGVGAFNMTYQFSFVEEHFTDASNAVRTPSAVEGIIPSYQVMDLSMSYCYKFIKLEASVNNLTDNLYFTRRAAGYPGPGIIPSDGRTFFLTLEFNF